MVEVQIRESSVWFWFESAAKNKSDEPMTSNRGVFWAVQFFGFPRVMAGIRRCGRNPRAHAFQRHLLPYVGRSVLGEGEG